jgi:hypothetical protein
VDKFVVYAVLVLVGMGFRRYLGRYARRRVYVARHGRWARPESALDVLWVVRIRQMAERRRALYAG